MKLSFLTSVNTPAFHMLSRLIAAALLSPCLYGRGDWPVLPHWANSARCCVVVTPPRLMCALYWRPQNARCPYSGHDLQVITSLFVRRCQTVAALASKRGCVITSRLSSLITDHYCSANGECIGYRPKLANQCIVFTDTGIQRMNTHRYLISV